MFLKFKKKIIAIKVASIFAFMSVASPLYAQEAASLKKAPIKSAQIADDDAKKSPNWGQSAFNRVQEKENMANVVPVTCKKPVGRFPWNLEKAKIIDVVDQISRLTCKSFILSKDVRPSHEVSVISRASITVDEAWQAFLSMLESNDLALIEVGQYNKIVARKSSVRQPLPVFDRVSGLPNNEGMVTYLHDVRHIPKEVALSIAKNLISREGQVLPVGDSFLVMSDGSSNIRRVMDILQKVDIEGAANRVNVIELIHAEAQEVQKKLTEIFDAKGSSSDRERRFNAARSRSRGAKSGGGDEEASSFSLKKIIADERTNKLIVIASDQAYARIKDMIDVLDTEASDASSQGQINVYYVKNGDAKKISATLSTVIQGNSSSSARRSSRPSARGTGNLFEGDIRITADETTNAIVVVSSPRDYKSLAKVIAKLDKPRIQVYVEAAILDIGLTDNNTFGMNAFGAIPGMGGAGSLGVLASPGGVGLATGLATAFGAGGLGAAAAGLAKLPEMLGAFNFIGPSVPLGNTGIQMPGMGLALEALQKYSNVDVLSTPSLLTLDNEKAEMSVGEKVPTVSSATTLGGTNGVPIQNITYQDVKLSFAITPHVNEDDIVRLEVEQDVNELGELEVVTPTIKQNRIRTKSAKTTVTVRDQQTVVIGGLISQVTKESESKIPVVGDIPVIGYLFGKKKTKTIEKKNLTLVMTVYVIRSEQDMTDIYDRKMKEREEFGKLYFGDKITKYDPHVDYDKKTGPVYRLIDQVDVEMQKVENGGQGQPGETVIRTESESVKEDPQAKPSGLEIGTIKTNDSGLPPLDSMLSEELADELDELEELADELGTGPIDIPDYIELHPPMSEEISL